MPDTTLDQNLLLPELKVVRSWREKQISLHLLLEKTSAFEVCPTCANPAYAVYDRRTVRVKDDLIRGKAVVLHIKKRRFFCKPCRRPFTEPIPGIKKGRRHTERYRRSLMWACEMFQSLKQVRQTYRCSFGFVYKAFYEQLELQRRKVNRYPWPIAVGLDEHFFKRKNGFREFVTMVVDQKNKRLFELVEGRSRAELEVALQDVEGREHVKVVVMDMAGPYRAFAKTYFPNALRVADKFHVLRLLNPALNRARRELARNEKTKWLRRLLLKSRKKLSLEERSKLDRILTAIPNLRRLYEAKERLHLLYRIRGYARAKKALQKILDELADSPVAEIKTLRNTLLSWRKEVLGYFKIRITNGRTEGFNNKAKLVKKQAYGYKSFKNYRLRLLSACR